MRAGEGRSAESGVTIDATTYVLFYEPERRSTVRTTSHRRGMSGLLSSIPCFLDLDPVASDGNDGT